MQQNKHHKMILRDHILTPNALLERIFGNIPITETFITICELKRAAPHVALP